MNPFTIRCTTCRRQLLVRSAAAIGKLLTCPVCGSMVMVEPPGEFQAAQGRAPTAGPSSGGGPGGRHAVGARSRVGPQEPALTALDPQQADTVPDEMMEPPGNPPHTPEAPIADSSVHAAAGEPPSSENVAHRKTTPSEQPATLVAGRALWMSRESQLLRRWLMITAVGTAAALLTILSLGFWLGTQQAHRSPSAQKPDPATGQRPQKGVSQDSVGTDSVATEKSNTGGAADRSLPGADTANGQPVTGQQGEPQGEAVAGPRQTSPRNDEGSQQASSASVAVPETNAVSGATRSPPAHGAAGGDAGAGNLATGPASTAPCDLGRRAPTVAGALRDLEALAADAIVSPRALTGASLYDLLPHPGRTFDAAAALPKPQVRRPVNAHNQLAMQLPSIEFPHISLTDLCRFVQELTNVPITIDVDSLHRAGILPDVPVTVSAKNEDLASILRKALQPLNLEWRTDATQLLVTAIGMDAIETVTYDVYDLVADDAARHEELQSWLENLVAPAAWQRHGGPGTLRVEKGRLQVTTTRAVQYEVRLFCERLRIARGGRPQGSVPDFAAAQQLRIRAALDTLAQTVTIHEPIGAPLIEILDNIGRQADLAITVDWQGLTGEGWTLAALARLDVADVAAAEALQQLLGPMRLCFRVINAKTIQVTTLDRAWKLEEVEFFPLEPIWQKDEGRQVLRRIRGLLADGLGASAGQGRFVVDLSSRTLILAAPQYRVAQVAGLLERLAAPAEQPEPALPSLE